MEFNDVTNPIELLKYMSNNIKYGFIGKNNKIYDDVNSKEWNDWYEQCIVQTGKQVLDSKIGTCWDQVELERLWFENNNYEIKTIFIWFDINTENDYPTHTFLLYKNDNKWYWFENSFESCKGIHEFDNVDAAIEEVINKQLEYAVKNGIAKIEDKKYIKIHDYSKLEHSLSVDEYIKHVLS